MPYGLHGRKSVGRIPRLTAASMPPSPQEEILPLRGKNPAFLSFEPQLSKDVIELIGVVEEAYPNTTFSVRITSEEAKDHTLLCHLAGRMRVHKVRILPGDRVRVEMTPYDLQKGRIVYRFRTDDPLFRTGTAAPIAPQPPKTA